MISIVGCLIGIAIGVGGAELVHYFANTDVSISSQSIILAFAVAASVGIFFGYYPALKAAKLNPIEALRYQ
jgi:putative ABC transport system permease protein